MRNKNMIFAVRKAWAFTMKVAFVTFGLLAIWTMGGMAENASAWWLYALASFGSGCAALLLLGYGMQLDDEIAADLADYKGVPVRKSGRRG